MKSSKLCTQHEAPQEPPYPSQDWTQIDADTTVEVRYPSGYSYQAIVDEKSPDSSLVWVFGTNGHGRKMYGNWDGVQLLNGAAVPMPTHDADLIVPFALGEHTPELVHPRKHLAPARTRTAQIDTAELKSIESTQAVMS
ncbi:hypothetical protein [Arthrobacter globiformis]|uniref:hypothetical protein n=1 Tax=Arthrobacter globiformis TaxID=1665 RepID=UPI0027D88399|nr:hypothetical protein [Arthrobacter globiformis]